MTKRTPAGIDKLRVMAAAGETAREIGHVRRLKAEMREGAFA